jgi:hypothetical protein
MGGIMTSNLRSNEGFTAPLRMLFALLAVATLLSNSPWEQPDQLSAIAACASSAMWAVLAIFGYKPGWRRQITWAVLVACLALVTTSLLGVA